MNLITREEVLLNKFFCWLGELAVLLWARKSFIQNACTSEP